MYVDDIVLTGSNASKIELIVADLDSNFQLKDLGRLNYFLGMDVQLYTQSIILCQKKYIGDLIDMIFIFV